VTGKTSLKLPLVQYLTTRVYGSLVGEKGVKDYIALFKGRRGKGIYSLQIDKKMECCCVYLQRNKISNKKKLAGKIQY